MADQFDGTFIEVINSRGEKQIIPAEWLDHPVLSKGFKRPPSQRHRGEEPVTSRTTPGRRGKKE